MSEAKPPIEHKDKLGRTIALDDFVAYPSHNSLEFGRVIKINPKMVKVAKVTAGRSKGEYNKYPADMVLIDAKDMTWYLLKNTK